MTTPGSVTFSPGLPLPGTVKLPNGPWIPNPDQITDSATGILNVIATGLHQWGLDEGLERIVQVHGETIQIPRTESAEKQLIVSFRSIELGDAGEKRFQFMKGDIGSFIHHTAMFGIELWFPWPTPTGGISQSLAPDPEVATKVSAFNRAGYVMFACLRALAMGGVVVNPPIVPTTSGLEGIIPGPMTPKGPSGGLAGFACDLQLQYS